MLQNIYKSITDYFSEYLEIIRKIENPYIELTEVLKNRVSLLEEAVEIRNETILLQNKKIEFLQEQLAKNSKFRNQEPFPMPKKRKSNLIYLKDYKDEDFDA